MPLATLADVEAVLGHPLSTFSQAAAATLLVDYQREIEEILGRLLTPQDVTETIVWENRAGMGGMGYPGVAVSPFSFVRDTSLLLRYRPVISVASVVVNGQTWAQGTNYGVTRTGIVLVSGVPVDAAGLTRFVVVYHAGVEDVHRTTPAKNAVVARVARAVARGEDDATGAKSVQVEGEHTMYHDEGFTKAELDACSRLRRWLAA